MKYPYPYRGSTQPLEIVSNWCTAGGRNPPAMVRQYLEAIDPAKLAGTILANWRVEATRDQLTDAARFYSEQVLK